MSFLVKRSQTERWRYFTETINWKLSQIFHKHLVTKSRVSLFWWWLHGGLVEMISMWRRVNRGFVFVSPRFCLQSFVKPLPYTLTRNRLFAVRADSSSYVQTLIHSLKLSDLYIYEPRIFLYGWPLNTQVPVGVSPQGDKLLHTTHLHNGSTACLIKHF